MPTGHLVGDDIQSPHYPTLLLGPGCALGSLGDVSGVGDVLPTAIDRIFALCLRPPPAPATAQRLRRRQRKMQLHAMEKAMCRHGHPSARAARAAASSSGVAECATETPDWPATLLCGPSLLLPPRLHTTGPGVAFSRHHITTYSPRRGKTCEVVDR